MPLPWWRIRRNSARSQQGAAPAERVGLLSPSTCGAGQGLTTCSPARACASAAVLGQPGGQVGGAAEIEQCLRQGFQLLQRQRLDPGCGGVAEGAAATVEQAKSDRGFAFLPPLLPALLNPLLGDAGVAQVFGGNGGELHD
jgi:hypothetical protein